MSHPSGLRYVRQVLDAQGNSLGLALKKRILLVDINQPVYGFKVTRLSTTLIPQLRFELDDGATRLPINRVGQIFRFPVPYDRGIYIGIQSEEVSPASLTVPPATTIELAVATTPEAADLLWEGTEDTWELSEGFTLAAEQVGGVNCPQVVFASSNVTGLQTRRQARINWLLVSSSVAGVMVVTAANATGVAGLPAFPRRSPVRSGENTTFNAFQLSALGTVAALPAGPWLARTHIPAGSPILLPLLTELVTANPKLAGSGDALIITGPATANLEVTADWQEEDAFSNE